MRTVQWSMDTYPGHRKTGRPLWPGGWRTAWHGRQKVAFFCHTTAHWTLAVADPGSRTVRVFDSYSGRSAGQEVGLALATFFSVHLPTPSPLVAERRDWRYSVTDCELQSNNSDCGPHSILNFLRAVAFHRDGRWYPGPGVSAIRRRVAAMLLSPVVGSSWCADQTYDNVEP
jgi:Ulp1 family protease